MKIAVLGTGSVGQTLAAKLDELGHEVAVGTRDVEATLKRSDAGATSGGPFAEWHRAHPRVAVLTFADAIAHGEMVFSATNGAASLDALRSAGSSLDTMLIIDVSNPLDFSAGFPPTLLVSNSDTLAEQIQREFPAAKVVKTLNTVNAAVMVDPRSVGDGDHSIFISGNDPDAKARVTSILTEWFGWTDVIDLGDLASARGAEMYLPLWIRLMGTLGTTAFNIKVVR